MLPFVEPNLARRAQLIQQINDRHLPTIQDVWRRCVEYMQREFPGRSRQLQRRILSGHTGSPAVSPDGLGNPVDGQSPAFGFANEALYDALARTGNLRLGLTANASVIFGDNNLRAAQELDRFYEASRFFLSTGTAIQEDLLLALASDRSRSFALHNHPQFGQPQMADIRRAHPGVTDENQLRRLLIEARIRYLPRADRCFRIMQEVQNYAQVILSLNGQQGLSVNSFNELRRLGMTIQYNANTHVFTTFRFGSAVPPNLDGTERANDQWDELAAWVERHRPAIDRVMLPVRRALGLDAAQAPIVFPAVPFGPGMNPGEVASAIGVAQLAPGAFQDAERRRAAREDQPGFVRVGHENTPGTVRINGNNVSYDYIVHDFRQETLPNGQVRITRVRTYYKYPELEIGGVTVRPSFYNLVGTQVGEQTFGFTVSPDSLVACLNQSGDVDIRVVRPQPAMGSHTGLEGWRRGQQFEFAVHRYGALIMDAGMVLTGGMGFISGLARRQFGSAAIALLRVGIGGSGFLHLDPRLRRAREVAMLLDISGQMLSSRYRQLGGLASLGDNPSRFRRVVHFTDRWAHRGMYGGMGVAAFQIIPETLHNISGHQNNFAAVLLGERETRPVPVGLPRMFEFTNPQVRNGARDAFREYLRNLFPGENLPANIQEIQRNVEALLATPLNDPRRAAYCRQLMAHFRMNGDQVARMHEELRSETITDAQMRGRDFDRDRRPSETQVAAGLAIMLLTVRPDGTFPDVLVDRPLTVSAWEFTRQDGPAHPRTGTRETRTYRGGGNHSNEVVTQQLRIDDLSRFLRRYVTADAPVTAARMATAEGLWHFGFVSNGGLGAIYRDAVLGTNQALAVRALRGGTPNGINFGQLIYEMQREEAFIATQGQFAQSQSLIAPYNLTSTDLLLVLRNQIRPPGQGNADIRAALIGITGALNPDVCNGSSSTFIHHMTRLWHQHGGNPGAFATQFFNFVAADSQRQTIVPPVVPVMPLGPGDLAAAVAVPQIDLGDTANRHLRDALILLDAGPTRLQVGAFNDRLIALLRNANPARILVILSHIRWESLNLAQRTTLLTLLTSTPPNDQNELVKIAILNRIPQLLTVSPQFRALVQGNPEQALGPLRAQAATYCRQLITTPPEDQPDGNYARGSEDVRLAAVRAIGFFGQADDQATIAALAARIQPNANGVLREGDSRVRLAILIVLNRLRPANFRQLLEALVSPPQGLESDPAVLAAGRRILREFAMTDRPNEARTNQQFQTMLAHLLTGEDFGWNHAARDSGRLLMVNPNNLQPCTRPDAEVRPAPQNPMLLVAAVNGIAEGTRTTLRNLLNQPTLTAAERQTLLSDTNKRNTCILILAILSEMVQADGAAALQTDRALRLIVLLREAGNSAAPALFAVIDNPAAPAALRQFAQARITSLSNQLRDSQNLQDAQGNNRVLGPNGRPMTIEEWIRRTYPLVAQSTRNQHAPGFFAVQGDILASWTNNVTFGWLGHPRRVWEDWGRRLDEQFSTLRPNSLWSHAMRGDRNALRAMCYIIETGANFIVDDPAHGAELQALRNEVVRVSAAVLLYRCGQSATDQASCASRLEVRGLILALLRRENLHPSAEQVLFLAIRRMNEPNDQGIRLLSNVEAAEAYLMLIGKRIWSQNQIPNDPHTLQMYTNCLNALRNLYCRDERVIGLLQAIAHPLARMTGNPEADRLAGRRVDPQLGEDAQHTLDFLLNRVVPWFYLARRDHNTGRPRTPDRITPSQPRANAIEAALRDRTPGDDNVIEAIFRATYGLDDNDGRILSPEDPLVRVLTRLMAGGPHSQRIQLAASIAVLRLRIGVPEGQDLDAVDRESFQRQARSIRVAAIRNLCHLSRYAQLECHQSEALDQLHPRNIAAPMLQAATDARHGVFFYRQLMEDRHYYGQRPSNVATARRLAATELLSAVNPARPAGGTDPVEMIFRACRAASFLRNDDRLRHLDSGMRNSPNPRVVAACAVELAYRRPYMVEAIRRLGRLYANTNNHAVLRNEIAVFLNQHVRFLREAGALDGLPPNDRIFEFIPNGFRIQLDQNRALEIITPPNGPPQRRVFQRAR
jgi:hypothetical protein